MTVLCHLNNSMMYSLHIDRRYIMKGKNPRGDYMSNKVIYCRVIESVNRFSGFCILIDINTGYGWRHSSLGSWQAFSEWLANQDHSDFRVFVSGR